MMSPATPDSPVTLLLGTRRGLFRISNRGHTDWEIGKPQIEGYQIAHVCHRPGQPHQLVAAANHRIWGAHIYRSEDGGATWRPMPNAPCHPQAAGVGGLKAIWYLTYTSDGARLFAGIDPAGLFYSDDDGATWHAVAGLNNHRTRGAWEHSRGLFAVHSVYVDPQQSENLYAAVSAGGVYRSEDAGATWHAANTGVRAEHIPGAEPEAGHNVHRLVMHPAQPARLYRQCYNGVYRSDDGARSWVEISGNVPSDYGFAIVCHPDRPDSLFRVPLSSSHMRATVDGRLRVYRTDDAGATWTDRSSGLPQAHAYVTVLREAAASVSSGTDCSVFIGTSGGHLFGSGDGARRWDLIAGYLPPIASVLALRQ